jgi:hypothetical protein
MEWVYNAGIQECDDYQPIQAVKNQSPILGDDASEDVDCDSCIHYNNGECGVYKKING